MCWDCGVFAVLKIVVVCWEVLLYVVALHLQAIKQCLTFSPSAGSQQHANFVVKVPMLISSEWSNVRSYAAVQRCVVLRVSGL